MSTLQMTYWPIMHESFESLAPLGPEGIAGLLFFQFLKPR